MASAVRLWAQRCSLPESADIINDVPVRLLTKSNYGRVGIPDRNGAGIDLMRTFQQCLSGQRGLIVRNAQLSETWSNSSGVSSSVVPAAAKLEYRDMAFEDLIAKIDLFLSDVENDPEDSHELLEHLHLEVNQLRATGQPVPDDLARLVKALEDEFSLRGLPVRNGNPS